MNSEALFVFYISLTISNVTQPLEHELVAAAEALFRSFQQLQLDSCTRSLPADPAGSLHSPECDRHLSLGPTLAVLL